MLIHILDSVLAEIAASVAAHPPERGGALLGPPGQPQITRFLHDEDAQTSHTTFQPSLALAERVKEIEHNEGLEFRGLIHSHPGGLDRPSTADERELAVGLALNPHMPFYIAPIVTLGLSSGSLEGHELACGPGKISFFAAFRSVGIGATAVRPISVGRVPTQGVSMHSDMEKVRVALGGPEAATIFHVNIEGVALLAGRLRLEGVELLVLAGDHYPALPPLFLMTGEDGQTEQMQAPWLMTTPAEDRLMEAVRSFAAGPGPLHRTFGLPRFPALTASAERAAVAGWSPIYTNISPEECVRGVKDGLFARSAGLLSRVLENKTVLLPGLGSGGSYAAEMLTRAGVGGFVLVDPEIVEASNLSRAVYTAADIGVLKTDALARRLLAINPGLQLECHAARLQDLSPERLATMVDLADLVYGGTDDPQAQHLLNAWAGTAGKPAVFPALYAGARGGEIIISVPGRTACYLCATQMRHVAEQRNPVSVATDYGTGRLVGEVALGADIHHVESAAIKIALSLLLPPGEEASLTGFMEDQIAAGATYCTMAMSPDYWFYPQIFGGTPGQFAYQSVWMTPERIADCPVCGEAQYCSDPHDAIRHTPRFPADLSFPADLPCAGEDL